MSTEYDLAESVLGVVVRNYEFNDGYTVEDRTPYQAVISKPAPAIFRLLNRPVKRYVLTANKAGAVRRKLILAPA